MRGGVSLRSFLLGMCLLCLLDGSFSQVLENFGDGNFTENPRWEVSNESGSSDFVVEAGRLRSSGPTSTSKIWISTEGKPTYVNDLLTWQFTVVYNQAPSGTNNVRIYLGADLGNLLNEPEGYYLQLGESGSGDGIDLFKSTSNEPIISDPQSSLVNSIELTIRITRSNTGMWSVYKAEIGSNNFEQVGIAEDTDIGIGDYFGILVSHTSSRNQSFFFDDITLPFPDVIPPSLEEINILTDRSLSIAFSEPLTMEIAENTLNYNLSSVGNPIAALLEGNTVELTFEDAFINASNYTLLVKNISDEKGNVLSMAEAGFFYFQQPDIHSRDIIISEFFADPDPPNDLPLGEYVEIFNRSDKVFDLGAFTLGDLSIITPLEEEFIFPNGYVIICKDEFEEQFGIFGKTIGINPFPTLNNSGDVIKLSTIDGRRIDSIRYDLSWYRSVEKQSGGWSVELIDPTNDCVQKANWVASENLTGGTPGVQNSVFAEKPDLTPPEITSAIAVHPDTLEISFNETLDPTSLQVGQFIISPQISVIEVLISNNLQELQLVLEPLTPGILYHARVTGIKDCPGNLLQPTEISFSLIEEAGTGDLLINEILFNPFPDGHDFIEIVNTSEKYINLKHHLIGNFNEQRFDNARVILNSNVVIAPGEYLVFTTENNLRRFYSAIDEEQILEVDELPSMPNDKGSIVIADPDSTLIDLFEYNEDFHFELLEDPEGVSLERISLEEVTENQANWTSSASTVGFATPGQVNSQSIAQAGSESVISVHPKVIVPDGTGQNDFATINYHFQQPGYVANVTIFDIQGREIARLANNETLGLKGLFTWNGLDENGRKARTGYYIVYFEIFSSSGEVSIVKEKVVVGTHF